MKKIVFVVFVVALLAAGCGKTAVNGPVEEGVAVTEQQQNADIGDSAAKTVPEGAKGATLPQDSKETATASNGAGTSNTGDLVIKSENQVQAGSKQAMVNQLDKDINSLVDALNKLEDVNENELVIQ